MAKCQPGVSSTLTPVVESMVPIQCWGSPWARSRPARRAQAELDSVWGQTLVQVSLLPFADSVTLGQARHSTFFCFSFLDLQNEKRSLGGFNELTHVKAFSKVPST